MENTQISKRINPLHFADNWQLYKNVQMSHICCCLSGEVERSSTRQCHLGGPGFNSNFNSNHELLKTDKFDNFQSRKRFTFFSIQTAYGHPIHFHSNHL
jgi:hypothetical protein